MKMRILKLTIFLSLFNCFLVLGQANDISEKVFTEIEIKDIDCIKKNGTCQFSGLSWHGEDLILLPQYPGFPNTSSLEGSFYSLNRRDLVLSIEGNASVTAKKISVSLSLPIRIKFQDIKHEGYEAILFDSDIVYALIESKKGKKSYLVKGKIDGNGIHFSEYLSEFVSFSGIEGMAKEAMTLAGSNILILDEMNCKCGSKSQKADLFSPNGIERIDEIEIPKKIENRITDATSMDSDGNFWVSNFIYHVGEHDKKIIEHCKTNALNSIQQIHELKYDFQTKSIKICQTIKITGPNPVPNWEGIARLDSALLLINDDNPFKGGKTIFGYIKID